MQESLISSIAKAVRQKSLPIIYPFSLVLCLLFQGTLGANLNSFSPFFRKTGWGESTTSHQLPELFFTGRHVMFLEGYSSSSGLGLLGVI